MAIFCFLLLAIASLTAVKAKETLHVNECGEEWRNQFRCLDDITDRRAQDDSSFPIPRKSEQSRFKSDVERCFRKSRCTSPIPSDEEERVRMRCFKDAKRQLDDDLQRCADNNPSWFTPNIPDWKPVNYPEADLDQWRYAVLRVYDASRNPDRLCDDVSPRRRQGVIDDIKDCIHRIHYDFEQRPPSGRSLPSYWCEEDARCWVDKVSGSCRNLWEDRVQKAICDCSNNGNYLRSAQDKYRDCFDRDAPSKSRSLVDRDPALDWLSDYAHDYCQSRNNHPCRNERRDAERSRRRT